MNPYVVEAEIGGRIFRLETGSLARQATSSVLAGYADTAVLAALVFGEPRNESSDFFFPLTVEYREKHYASGKIPGGFIKREGRPSTQETLGARLIDRPLRPLVPLGFSNDCQLHANVLSADQENIPDVVAMNAASATFLLSGVPFDGPVGSVRIGYIHDEFVVNPTIGQLKDSKMDMVISGTPEGILMVEAGTKEIPEELILRAFEYAQEPIQTLIDLQKRLRKITPAPEPREWTIRTFPEDLPKRIRDRFGSDLEKALFIAGKRARGAALDELQERVLAEFGPTDEEGEPLAESPTPMEVSRAYALIEEETLRHAALRGKRVDGRPLHEVRPITIRTGLLPRTHGSALFQRGETQALVTTTLGTKTDAQVIDGLLEEYEEHFMLHYNFPPFCTGEIKPLRGPGRREIGHGALAQRAIQPILPSEENFPYTVRVVSEILESNGSSSMATVCGATLSLMDAGVHISAPVAGIAMGLIKEGDKWVVLTDILGTEDALGDMDFKVAGTEQGVTAIQMDLKRAGIDLEIMKEALKQAGIARLHVLQKMKDALASPRESLSPYAPRVEMLMVNPEKIGKIIGKGGETIREIEATSGAEVDIDDDMPGRVYIYAKDNTAFERARDMIKGLTEDLEPGKIYKGTVVSMRDFGAFIELQPSGQEGLLHITEIANGYVERVDDFLKVGQELHVKLVSLEPDGKMRLSYRQALQEMGEPVPEGKPREGGGPPRGPRPPDGGRDRFRSSRPGPRESEDRRGGGPPFRR